MKKINKTFSKFLNYFAGRSLLLAVLCGFLPAMLIVYAFYTFALDSGYASLDKKKQLILQKEEEVARGKSVELSENEFRQEFRNVINLFESSLTKVPKETEISAILASLQALGTSHQVSVTSLNVANAAVKSPNADKLYERELPVIVAGNYDDVLRFWLDISKLERILVVRDFSVQNSKNEKSGRPTVVTATFSLLAFHAPPTSEFPQIPSDLSAPIKQVTQLEKK